jgi:transcriptional regulator with XRE-family HTH domain
MTESIEQSLAAYRLGEKLRRLRLKRKVSLVDLGKQTGLSPSMISQLENGKLTPTLPTLTRLATVFDVGLDFFFAGTGRAKTFTLVRAAPRRPVDERDSPRSFFEALSCLPPDRGFEAYAAEFPPGAEPSGSHCHDGTEFIYVFTGSLEIRTPAGAHVLMPGDCCRFDSSEPHSYRCASEGSAWAFMIAFSPKFE